MTYKPLLPSDLLALWDAGLIPQDVVTWDTETSGLYADDGARVSTVSVAFEDVDGSWMDMLQNSEIGMDRVGWGLEEIAPGIEAAIVSLAWPFDQGTQGKPEDTGQDSLFDIEQDNLPLKEWEALLEWMRRCGRAVGLNAHNAKFDLEKMLYGVRRWPGVGYDFSTMTKWDTQIGCAMIWPLEPTSLKPTSARLWGSNETAEQEVIKRYLKRMKLPAGRWDLMPWDVIGRYAEDDSRKTAKLLIRQRWEIEQGTVDWMDARWSMDRRMDTMRTLFSMEKRGLPYDEIGSRQAADECMNRAERLLPSLPFSPTDPAAKEYFFGTGTTSRGVECLNMVPYSVTDKGSPQLTQEILDRMVADEVPHAKTWAEYKKVVNAASLWYNGYADKMGTDGRLRTHFRQNGTRSTRFSVERVNLQAIPQDYRLSAHAILDGIPTPTAFIKAAVPDGWRLFDLDLQQAELRVGALMAQCGRMLSMIERGEDLHTFTTMALFPDIPLDDPLFKSKWRQVGKRGNFSLQFGSQGPTFKKMVSKETGIVLTDQEADRIVRDWNGLYPEYSKAIALHQRRVEKRQAKYGHAWMGLVNGERRWFQAYEEAHKAFNQRVQGSLGQFAIDWMLASNWLLERAGYGDKNQAGLLLTVHDSQKLLLPDNDEGLNLANECAQIGSDLWAKTFPGVPGGVDIN